MLERNLKNDEIEALFYNACDKHRYGQLIESRTVLEAVIQADPHHFHAWHLLGIIAAQRHEYQLSADLIARAIELNPESAGFYSNRGLALQHLMQLEAAIASYDRAIEIKPNYAEAYYNRAVSFQALGQFIAAVSDYDRAIALRPSYAEAYCSRGVVFQKLGMLPDAVASYDMAIAIRPAYALAFSNRGVALQELKQLEAAVASCDRAIEIMPNLAEAHYNRGIALKELNRLYESVASYDRAIEIQPSYVEALYNRGNALKELKLLDDAVDSFDRAIKLKSPYAEAQWNKGLTLLLRGELESGLKLYEWRWKKDGSKSPSERFAKPLWTGVEPVRNKSILVYSEQGLGDTIHFCRYLSKLNDLGATVLFSPQKPLRGLMKSLSNSVRIVDEMESGLEFDFHVPLVSLPLAFQTNLKNIPALTPYLFAEKERVVRWKEAIGTEGFKIGVCWQGAASGIAVGRSFHVNELQEISSIEGVRLISLQKGAGVTQLAASSLLTKVETLGDSFDAGPEAFMDTAAVMQLCDLIITSDTAVAHLAGALGLPVWLVLKFVPDWRWFLDRDDSPWYPTMRLFRQQSPDNWSGPLSEVEKELRRRFNETG